MKAAREDNLARLDCLFGGPLDCRFGALDCHFGPKPLSPKPL